MTWSRRSASAAARGGRPPPAAPTGRCCPGPADRGYKNFVNDFARYLVCDPGAPRLSVSRARSSFICDHLAAGTAIKTLLAITGIIEAESLARYARHVPGVSSSKAALRARWRAEAAR